MGLALKDWDQDPKLREEMARGETKISLSCQVRSFEINQQGCTGKLNVFNLIT